MNVALGQPTKWLSDLGLINPLQGIIPPGKSDHCPLFSTQPKCLIPIAVAVSEMAGLEVNIGSLYLTVVKQTLSKVKICVNFIKCSYSIKESGPLAIPITLKKEKITWF
jgi:hypothetical protein